MNNNEMHLLSTKEKEQVLNVYNEIAESFDTTRQYIWPSVKKFIAKIPVKSHVLEAGCGNGKNFILSGRNDLHFTGFDISAELLKIARKNSKHISAHYLKANILDNPFEDSCFDTVLSIAVIHHLDTFEKRVQAIRECLRVLKPGGEFFFQVWAKESLVPGDNTVEWKIRRKDIEFCEGMQKNDIVKVVHRYYHIFDKKILGKHLKQVINDKVHIERIFYEKENWCVVLKKK